MQSYFEKEIIDFNGFTSLRDALSIFKRIDINLSEEDLELFKKLYFNDDCTTVNIHELLNDLLELKPELSSIGNIYKKKKIKLKT